MKGYGKLISIREAAERLGVSEWTVGRWARQGRFTTVKLGGRRLVPETELDRIIESNLSQDSGPEELRMVK